MKTKILFSLVAVLVIFLLGSAFRPKQPTEPYDLRQWGQLPVQHEGRIKPLDTVARSLLLQLHAKQTLRTDEGKLTALQWLWNLVYRIDGVDELPVFRIDQPDLVSLLGGEPGVDKDFSYAMLQPQLAELDRQFQRVPEAAANRTQFETAVMRLHLQLRRYQAITVSLYPPPMGTGMNLSLSDELERYTDLLQNLPKGEDTGRPDPMFGAFLSRYRDLARSQPLAVVPQDPAVGPWKNLWGALSDDLVPAERDPVVMAHARLADAARAGDPAAFNAALDELVNGPLAHALARHGDNLAREFRFNGADPFGLAERLYLLVFLLVCIAWMRGPHGEGWRQAAFGVLAAAFLVHTVGLGTRMLIQSLPPVTNLYSSAVFIGWAAAPLGLLLERYTRSGMGSAMAALAGFGTLIIASHLALSGDTMEQMRAVLNSNFWLTTHVITITLGYAAAFVAGILALLFLLRALVSSSIDQSAAKRAESAVFGTVCFTLLFSFVGTVLGGIWADQSWGRFWGWDPKENGALLIVIWNALILHAYAARIIRRRGLMLAAISGNIITSWSWFGTNMLGIGLHSYGFMSGAFFWLLLFWASQLMVICFALGIPRRWWRSAEALDSRRTSP